MKVRWAIILFHKGKRIERDVDEPLAAAATVKALNRKKGVKAHLVCFNRPIWPPEDDDMSAAGQGMTWCPYCRRWRWYSVPPYREKAEFMSPEWFMNTFHGQEIRVCQWCWVSEGDWYVKAMNGLFDREKGRRRRRKRRKR